MFKSNNAYLNELKSGCDKLGLTVSHHQYSLLLGYLDLLFKWNKAYNLTAVRNPQEMISRHLLDSLSVAPFFPRYASSCIDVGSGGGMPGIPLAILFPNIDFILLDSNGKKARFLLQAKLELKLNNLEIINDRVEKFTPSKGFSVIISRAFSSLNNFTKLTQHLGGEKTLWLAMKGAEPLTELQALPKGFYLDKSYVLEVPGCQGQRHLLTLRNDCTVD